MVIFCRQVPGLIMATKALATVQGRSAIGTVTFPPAYLSTPKEIFRFYPNDEISMEVIRVMSHSYDYRWCSKIRGGVYGGILEGMMFLQGNCRYVLQP